MAPLHRLLLAALALLGLLAAPALAQDASARPQGQPRLGINLNGPADWNTEVPFVDVFHLARNWISQKAGEGWGKGPELDLDRQGWVRRLAPGCSAETPLLTIEGGHYPSGTYTVLYDGAGQITFSNAQIVSEKPGVMQIKVDSARGGFFLQLRATDPANYIRNIRVILPGYEDNYKTQVFRPGFLDTWRGVACLRFMDWQETNGSKQQHWADRPTADDATWTRAGVPVEVMCDLANRLHANAWFCMPHMADDDYVRNFAQVVKEKLDPGLKAYIEYSNEVWNGQFLQSRYAGEEGMKLKLGTKPWEAGWHYTAVRSVQIFKIWTDVFGGHDRLVRVLASQAGNAYVAGQIVNWDDAYKSADALAIAPYISLVVTPNGKELKSEEVAGWTLDQVFAYLDQHALPQSLKWIQDNAKVAAERNLKLIAYEGGQHLVGAGGGENNQPMAALFLKANADPRMGALYTQYLDGWAKAGGDVFCYFSSVGQWSKWGSWGAMQYLDDDPAKSPKYLAIMEWAKQQGQNVNVPAAK